MRRIIKFLLIILLIVNLCFIVSAKDIFLIEKNVRDFIYKNSSKELLEAPFFIEEDGFLISTHLATYYHKENLVYVSITEYNSSELLSLVFDPFLNITTTEGSDPLDYKYILKNETNILRVNHLSRSHSFFIINEHLFIINTDINVDLSPLEDNYINKFKEFESPDKDKNGLISNTEMLGEIDLWLSEKSDFSRLLYIFKFWARKELFTG